MRHPTLAQRICLTLLRWYQDGISSLMPPSCRFLPTCSNYAMEAVERFGVTRGLWLTIHRLLRCHPFISGGFDPLPEEP